MPLIRSVLGSIHQGNGLFSSGGTQCTAIALFALATFFATNGLLTNLSAFDMDRILFEGNELYESIISNRPNYDLGTYLAHDDLPHSVMINGYNIETVIYYDIFYGMVGQILTPEGSGAVSMHDSITRAFELSDNLICTFGGQTIAVMYMEGHYYVFDSHACNFMGQTDPDGAAVMLQFSDILSLMEFLQKKYFNNIFNISPVILNYHFETAAAAAPEDHINYISTFSEINNSMQLLKSNDLKHMDSNEVMERNYPLQSFDDKGSSSIDNFVDKYFSNIKSWESFREGVDSSIHTDIEQDMSQNLKDSDHSYSFSKASRRKKTKRNSVRQDNGHATQSIKMASTNIVALDSNFQFRDFDEYCGHTLLTGHIVEINTSNSSNSIKACDQRRVINAFLSDIRSRPLHTCASCDRFLYDDQVHNLKKDFLISINHTMLKAKSIVCSYCFNCIKKGIVPSVNSKSNYLDPGKIPVFLHGLSLMERRLICKIQVFMTVIILPGGQYAEKGLAIDFPVNFEQQVSTLPRTFDDANVITVSYEYNKEIKPTHVVRKDKISKALFWLQANNKLYKDVLIRKKMLKDFNISEEVIDQVEDVYDEFGIAPINYSVPDIDLANMIRSDTPHLALKSCNSKPVNAYDIVEGEESAFPHLFPFGSNGYKHPRSISISNFKYFQHRLYYKDGRFRKDISYLLHAVNYYENSRLFNSVNIHMRMRKNKNALTAGDLVDFHNNPDLLQNSYMFMKNVKGTAAYWKNNLLNLLATFKAIGPPSLFVTLSANDMHWPDLMMTLTGLDYDQASKITNGLHLVKKDPVLTALHFQRRFVSFLKNIIYGGSQPLGKVVDHFGRIEFQSRGSPHIHLFLWIENFSETFKDHKLLIEYIDKVVSTNSSKSQLAKKFQLHHHSNYCLRKSGRCRFGFPFQQCEKTRLLSNVDLGSENQRNKFYETQRPNTDSFINPFNPTLLENWQANMDIQIIGDSKSAAYYVCAYLCKSEPEDLKFALSHLISSMDRTTNQRTRMIKIGACMLKTRKLSAQEAAYRLLSDLHLIFSSRTVLSLNTKPQGKRFRVLKSKKDRQELDQSSTDIFHNNIVDYYMARPTHLHDMCLYEFTKWYVKCNNVKTKYSNANERIILKYPFEKVMMRKRKKSIVVRLPKLSLSSDDYFYSLLMSFLPFVDENTLMMKSDGSEGVYENAKAAFFDKKCMMATENLQSFTVIEEIENAMRFIKYSRTELAASLNPSTFENDSIACEEYPDADISVSLDKHFEADIDTNSEQHIVSKSSAHDFDDSSNHLHQLETGYFSEDQFQLQLKTLTQCQKKVMKTVMDHFIQKKESQLLLFISGGAGVGKSYVSKLIIEWLKISTATQMGRSPVMVCAPTGTAARNILGSTLHSALHLPVQHGNQPKFFELTAKALKKLRVLYSCIHTLLIDEISMVSSIMLEYTHKRLATIKDNDKLFGGLNVIVIGDFLQLRPVNGYYAFQHSYIWPFFKPLFLDENVRQKGDHYYAQLLNRARVGLLNKQDIVALQSRLIYPIPEDITRVLHLYPTLKQVKDHNSKMQALIPHAMVDIPAFHYFSQDDINKQKGSVTNDLIPMDDRNAGGLVRNLQLSQGSRVMLVRNIYTEKGLVNGALGFVVNIYKDKHKNLVTAIHVKFDDDKIGGVLKDVNEHNAISIGPICQEFYSNGRVIIREQFPLIQAWAATIHKVQGISLDKAAISIGNDIFENGMAYVALSRLRTISGLYLLAFNCQKVCPPMKALREYNRLRNATCNS